MGVRSPLLDGPLQRQLILLKLINAMDNRPHFGTTFNNDPDSEVRDWLSKVGALMNRASLESSVKFKSAVSTSVQYWVPAMRSAQIAVNDTIEEINSNSSMPRARRNSSSSIGGRS